MLVKSKDGRVHLRQIWTTYSFSILAIFQLRQIKSGVAVAGAQMGCLFEIENRESHNRQGQSTITRITRIGERPLVFKTPSTATSRPSYSSSNEAGAKRLSENSNEPPWIAIGGP